MGNPRLIESTRGLIAESFHCGSVCLVDNTGKVIFSVGDINQLSFTRSALKPFQSIPLVESGAADYFKLSAKELAITCGSHNAEKEHIMAVNSILAKIGIDQNHLKCGAQMPTGKIPRNEMRIAGEKPRDIHNNCSGKHAGFLVLCVFNHWPLENYLNENHPSQVLIKETCAEMYEVKPNEFILGEDGCSAPNYATTLYHQAIAYKNLVSNTHSKTRNNSCKRIVDACTQFPLMVAGKDRYCTEIIDASKGKVIGKTGADGVFCMAFTELGLGCAIKIDDGQMGPQYFVAQAIIESLGIELHQALSTYRQSPIYNWNKHKIGVQKISNEFRDELDTIAK